jgi:hypothetical protein
MECVWLIRRPLDQDEATSYDTVNKYWNYAQSLNASISSDLTGHAGTFDRFPQTLKLLSVEALLFIGGRKSLATALQDVIQRGALVQLAQGQGIALCASSAGGTLNTVGKKSAGFAKVTTATLGAAFRGRGPSSVRRDLIVPETQRFTLIQLFHAEANDVPADAVIYFAENSVTLNRIYNVLVNNELLKEGQ